MKNHLVRRLLPASLLLLAVLSVRATAADVDYLREVKPILHERCFACHGALKQEGGLRLDTGSQIRQGGDSGAAIEPGKSSESLLVARVAAESADERMPPEGKPLTPDQIELLKRWIDGGAVSPTDEQPDEDPARHWAFQLPTQTDLPDPIDPLWSRNPVDAFIAAQREAHNLQPVPSVDRQLLLRRVYLDLIGLPPTRSQMQQFLDDTRDDAYERVVDELLESPHYGERWGRHWMDVWRYSDWFGLGAQLRYSQKHIWHWRDWIVASLNEDKGYDRMVVEMLAADEVAPTDRDTLRATGFLARNYFLFNRTTWLDDTIEHTSQAFLGLTMNCAKCHDHKYDPISQVDYYRMRAIFEPHQVRLDAMPGQTDFEKDGLPRVFDAHPEEPTYLHIRGDAANPDKDRVITPGVPAILAAGERSIEPVELPAESRNPALQSFVLEDHLRMAEQAIAAAQQSLVQSREVLASLETASVAAAASAEADDPAEPNLFLKDDFKQLDAEQWEIGAGKWKIEGDTLTQTQIGASRAYLRTRREHPADFQATLKFTTTGGAQWRSVGLAFDVAGAREKMVYLSAVSPGSKLQVSYKTGADQSYPPSGKIDLPVSLDTPYEMSIRVRDGLVNVSLNGQHLVAYELPVERSVGRIDLVAFDAAAKFHSIEIHELSASVKLMQPAPDGSVPQKPMTIEQAKLALVVTELALAAAEARPVALRSAHAADVAKHQPTPPDSSSQLIHEAAAAARSLDLAQAEQAVAVAQQKLAEATEQTKAKAEQDLKTAQTNVEKARTACQQPGESYASIRASLKALEGPAEKDDSRFAPYPTTSTGRRTAFARWIADPQNPLTARVAVNHIWTRHFGQPLVETVTDFGRRAPKPAQHALLDWLAVDFVSHDWSMKRLHRMLVTSQTYRLSTSVADADASTRDTDPQNDYYWRRKPIRMESQVVRDSLLQLAGTLDPTLGGPTIDPSKEDTAYRRSLYFTHSRDDQSKFLTMFDDADIGRCYRRDESIVPQQALTLANSKLSLTLARKMAENLQSELGEVSDEQFVVTAFKMILAVAPTADETSACVEALQQTKDVLAKSNHAEVNSRARADLVHALLNHNDFVTIR
ncbi:MAG: PSD1 and planctomycete cytochrome C domain-containing protein [Planctomycetota bacterium]|nr:PSD1 and planctomycete cytochrome C domain-containing protein [Planctomycetota bacterium]